MRITSNSLAHCRRDALHAVGPDVTHGEDTRKTCFENKRSESTASARPPGRPALGPVAGDPDHLVGIQCRKNLIQSRFTVKESKGRGVRHAFVSFLGEGCELLAPEGGTRDAPASLGRFTEEHPRARSLRWVSRSSRRFPWR